MNVGRTGAAVAANIGNASPGFNMVPTYVIKKAWPIYRKEIRMVLHLCWKEGYDPTAFRNATLYALPKPGKMASLTAKIILANT